MTAAEQLRDSNTEVERACALLIAPAPEALDGCSGLLEVAVHRLETLRPALNDARGDPETLVEAWRLQRNVRRAGALLANVSEYHARWNELLALKTAGYLPGGHAAEAPRGGRLFLRG